MTDIPEDEWRYSINYGPEGEANYAFVYDGGGNLVSNLKIHHAIAVVEQMNARAAQAERMARMEEALRRAMLWTDEENDVGPWREDAARALSQEKLLWP